MTITETPIIEDTQTITEPAAVTERPAGDRGPAPRDRRGRTALAWGLVAGAAIAAVVLAVNVIDNDTDDHTTRLHSNLWGDVKDHPNYGQVTQPEAVAAQPNDEWPGDSKILNFERANEQSLEESLEDYARDNGLTGLSPASMGPAPAAAVAAVDATTGDAKDHPNYGQVTQPAAVAAQPNDEWPGDSKMLNFERANPGGADSSGEQSLEDYARDNGLTGLSPASMGSAPAESSGDAKDHEGYGSTSAGS